MTGEEAHLDLSSCAYVQILRLLEGRTHAMTTNDFAAEMPKHCVGTIRYNLNSLTTDGRITKFKTPPTKRGPRGGGGPQFMWKLTSMVTAEEKAGALPASYPQRRWTPRDVSSTPPDISEPWFLKELESL